jgi:predicted DCC family thiol-disulfide oxidoreductase YuxK
VTATSPKPADTRPVSGEPGRAEATFAADGALASLVYDGDCPFCSRYVRYLRLRDAVGKVELVNAREGGPLVEEIARKGYDLDGGMVLKMAGRYYHGSDCIHALALLSSDSDTFNRINAAIFRSPTLSRLLYPALRTGRNIVLKALGRTKIHPSG